MVRFASDLAGVLLVRESARVAYAPAPRAAVLEPPVRKAAESEAAVPEAAFSEAAVSEAAFSEAAESETAVSEAAIPEAGVLDPFDDADALEELGDRIATLAAHIHAATHRLLALVADFDRRRGWELGGHRSCAHWLATRTGIDLGAAREKVRAARALAGLPATSAAMARGELSFSAVRALTRVATPENEADLLELARGCTIPELERVVRGWRLASRAEEGELERLRHESRTFSAFPDLDGMVVVRGRLPPEVGTLLMRAIEAASDALYREAPRPPGLPADVPSGVLNGDTAADAARRRADALGLVAERALAAGFGGRDAEDGEDGGEEPDEDAREAQDEDAREAPVSGTRAARYQVVLHVDRETLRGEREQASGAAPRPGRSELEDGTRVSCETSRRLACDAAVVRVEHGPPRHAGRVPNAPGPFEPPPHGPILGVGRRTRTIPPALRRALEARDRGCRFPSCGLRFTDVHHVRHWGDGGETSLANCVLLCAHHHRLVHEGGWRMTWWGEGRPVFIDPRGGTHFEGRWRPPHVPDRPDDGLADDALADPADALLEDNRRRGIVPDPLTAGARWSCEDDIPTSVLFRAIEAAAGVG